MRPTALGSTPDRVAFGNRDGKRSTNTTYADDSALRECDESRGTRYSERHSAQNVASLEHAGLTDRQRPV